MHAISPEIAARKHEGVFVYDLLRAFGDTNAKI